MNHGCFQTLNACLQAKITLQVHYACLHRINQIHLKNIKIYLSKPTICCFEVQNLKTNMQNNHVCCFVAWAVFLVQINFESTCTLLKYLLGYPNVLVLILKYYVEYLYVYKYFKLLKKFSLYLLRLLLTQHVFSLERCRPSDKRFEQLMFLCCNSQLRTVSVLDCLMVTLSRCGLFLLSTDTSLRDKVAGLIIFLLRSYGELTDP